MAQMYIIAALAILCHVVTVSSHVCMINPHQRGSMTGLNTPKSMDCKLLTAPCGGRPVGDIVTLKSGSNFTVVFQKNLDHYVKATPGYFTVGFSRDYGKTFNEVARVPDMGEPSLHLYSANIVLPAVAGKPYQILQVAYMTHNPNDFPAFYQCADLTLY